MPVLRILALSKHFDGLSAIHNLGFTVEAGEMVAVIGPNGSGKTTLFNLISGFLTPDQGKIFFRGHDITGQPPHQICRRGLGRTFQIVQPFYNLRVRDHITAAIAFGKSPLLRPQENGQKVQQILQLVELWEKRDRPAKHLSLGELKRLELARALATDPQLLLLDEVTAGLTPKLRIQILELLKNLQQKNTTILMIEHTIKTVAEIAQRILVLDRGHLVAEGPPREIMENPRVIEAYLGEEEK